MITRMEAYSSLPSAPELPLAGNGASDDPIHIRDVQGLGPVKGEISSSGAATRRGEIYQGASIGKRNIVITVGFKPNWADQSIDSLRQMLYAYFMPTRWCKLRLFSDLLPPVDIEGICESVDPNIFSEDPELAISILHHKPDFIDANATLINGVVDTGDNTHVFNYTGTVDTGIELVVRSSEANSDYTGSLLVVVTSLGLPQNFTVNPITVDPTRYFKLSTIPGALRVQGVDAVDGTITNLMSKMSNESVWPVLQPGENILTVAAAEPGQEWTLAYYNRFGGL